MDIDMCSIYCTIMLQAGVQGHPLGKEKYKSQLQVTPYPSPLACCISNSKLTGRTNQRELLGNNHSWTPQLQPYTGEREMRFPLVSPFAFSFLSQLQHYLDQGYHGRKQVTLFMLKYHNILLYIHGSECL